VIAALNQVGVATTVTEPILVAFLGTVGGVLVVGLGGGLIQPMRQRWERLLSRAEADTAGVRRGLRTSAFDQPPYQARLTAPSDRGERVRTPGAAPS
jgi:hypothetical protein